MTFQGSSPCSMMRWRASLTHLGQSESVTRGQPSVGLVFCHDFSKGLSDHLGINDSLGLNWLKNWIALKAPLATFDNPFSTYLIGLCIVFLKVFLSIPDLNEPVRLLTVSLLLRAFKGFTDFHRPV